MYWIAARLRFSTRNRRPSHNRATHNTTPNTQTDDEMLFICAYPPTGWGLLETRRRRTIDCDSLSLCSLSLKDLVVKYR